MTSILLVVHVLAAIAIVVLVLMQQGKGADMGAAFGGGSQTLFGARGSANFLSRATGLLAALFFVTSLTLAYLSSQAATAPESMLEQVPAQTEEAADEVPVVEDELPVAEDDELPTIDEADDSASDGGESE